MPAEAASEVTRGTTSLDSVVHALKSKTKMEHRLTENTLTIPMHGAMVRRNGKQIDRSTRGLATPASRINAITCDEGLATHFR